MGGGTQCFPLGKGAFGAAHPSKLVFDGMYRRAGARPRHWVPVLNGCHSTKISKIDTFWRGQAPALRYERTFSVQPTDRKLAAGRRGHDISPTPRQTPIYWTARENRHAFFKSSPEGIPHLISRILYLVSYISYLHGAMRLRRRATARVAPTRLGGKG